MGKEWAARSNGTPNTVVSVMHRPPIVAAASTRTNRRPRVARRRAAAMPAAPAPTMTTSTLLLRGATCGAGADFLAAGCVCAAAEVTAAEVMAAELTAGGGRAAEAARDDRRVHRFMGCAVPLGSRAGQAPSAHPALAPGPARASMARTGRLAQTRAAL